MQPPALIACLGGLNSGVVGKGRDVCGSDPVKDGLEEGAVGAEA